jgi:hypothetical protein
MHYKKRKRRKGGIKGCGFCKPWKATGCRRVEKNERRQSRKANMAFREQVEELKVPKG